MLRAPLGLFVLIAALAIVGCGSSETDDGADAKSAYLNLEATLAKGDRAACSKMSGDYRNKLAASVQLFSADCPEVVREVGKGLRADRDLRTRSIDGVKVNGSSATLIAHSRYRGEDVRTKATMKQNDDGGWILAASQELDDVAPSAPLTAYRAYSKAFIAGDGAKACALSTERGQELIAKSIPTSHAGGTCKGAVKFLAGAAKGLPPEEVVGGDQEVVTSSLYTLQSNGRGTWVFRVVAMRLENGKWLFDYSRDLGFAPAGQPERSDIV